MTSARKIVVGTKFKEDNNNEACQVIMLRENSHWFEKNNRNVYALLILTGKYTGKCCTEYFRTIDELIDYHDLSDMEVDKY